jgi:hypothetical protein
MLTLKRKVKTDFVCMHKLDTQAASRAPSTHPSIGERDGRLANKQTTKSRDGSVDADDAAEWEETDEETDEEMVEQDMDVMLIEFDDDMEPEVYKDEWMRHIRTELCAGLAIVITQWELCMLEQCPTPTIRYRLG